MSYAEAIAELYQAPLSTFVAERKRLAGNLKVEGDKPGAAKLAKLGRPTTSAWVVNQLWWHARGELEAMFGTAERLRTGDLGATAAHRESLAKLRGRAATILTDGGHGATEATLRRVMTTIAALAATGSFEPDLPGTLAEDRDPPGFDAIGLVIPGISTDASATSATASPAPAATATAAPTAAATATVSATATASATAAAAAAAAAADTAAAAATDADADADADVADDDADVAEQRRANAELAREALRASEAARLQRVADAERRQIELAAAAERRKADEERARLLADRNRLEAALRTAQGEIISRGRAVEKLRTQLAEAEKAVADSRAAVADLERKLMELPELDE